MVQPPRASTGKQNPDDEERQIRQNLSKLGIDLVAALAQSADKSKAKRRARRPISSGTLWMLGLIPILLACLHIVIVSRGDMQTLRSLTENLDITALVLATSLPLFSTALTWVFLLILLIAVAPNSTKRPPRAFVIVSLSIVLLIDVIAMPLRYLAVNVAIFGVLFGGLLLGYYGRRLKPPWGDRVVKFAELWAKALLAALFVVPVIFWLAFIGVWMPQERLEIGGTTVEPVYVLSSDVRWTKYMDNDHKVHVAPTAEVTRRQIVERPQSAWSKTLLSMMRGNTVSEVPDPVSPRPTTTTTAEVPASRSEDAPLPSG